MTTQDNYVFQDFVGFAQQSSQKFADAVADASTKAGETLGETLYGVVEQGTETVGNTVAPIANHPLTKFATKVPGLSWLMAALGQVDVEAVQLDVDKLRRTYPLENNEDLAQRVIAESAWNAAGVGLATNFVPPLALMLLAVDLGAVVAIQAKMIYRIAAMYDFSPTAPARLGEVLAIWGISTGGSSAMKAGLSIVELLPGIGTAAGSVGNAAMVYGLGQVACRFYEAKQRAEMEEGDRLVS
ncbi:DUF697 domain-containing protein [Vacuolonema iberomarrocanum]|uniref:DUF697 domain-containing protein n=1 Tax=Vacuolonema iberomarrocanum TaxID=3454632 RepID=UPI0019DB0034|nr:DUF697 domain-containing protein [filamentous cyanobacterium LEGE 07170]